MNKNKMRNIIVAIIVICILGAGLIITVNPNLNLKDAILKMVELPQNVFHIRNNDDHKKTEDDQTIDEEKQRESILQGKVETPIDLFDDTDEETGQTGGEILQGQPETENPQPEAENPQPSNPSKPDQSENNNNLNELPLDILE